MLDLLWNALTPHIGSLASFLLLTNLIFVGWLAKKIASIDKKLPIQDGELKNMAKDMSAVSHRLDQIDNKLEDIGQLRERVAVIEDRFNRKIK